MKFSRESIEGGCKYIYTLRKLVYKLPEYSQDVTMDDIMDIIDKSYSGNRHEAYCEKLKKMFKITQEGVDWTWDYNTAISLLFSVARMSIKEDKVSVSPENGEVMFAYAMLKRNRIMSDQILDSVPALKTLCERLKSAASVPAIDKDLKSDIRRIKKKAEERYEAVIKEIENEIETW